MKKKNIKDDILRALVSEKVPVFTPDELLSKLNYDKSEIGFAILELEKASQLAILKPRTKDDTLRYSLTQDGEIFIRNTNYYEQEQKNKTNSFYKIADKAIAILGITTGIIFGINSCSSENKNDRLINLVEQKDSIINSQNKNLRNLNSQILEIKSEINILKENSLGNMNGTLKTGNKLKNSTE